MAKERPFIASERVEGERGHKSIRYDLAQKELFRYCFTSTVMLGRSMNLTTLFLGRRRLPKRLTRTSCTYFHRKLTASLLESAEGETKVCGRTVYRTRGLWLLNQKPTALRGPARTCLYIVFIQTSLS